MKKIIALVFASLLAFTCIASPPGTHQPGSHNAKIEMPELTYGVSVQDQAPLNCYIAIDATSQDIGFSCLKQSDEDFCSLCTHETASLNNLDISPFPAEIGLDLWPQVLKRFQLNYNIYGIHRRSNSPPLGLS